MQQQTELLDEGRVARLLEARKRLIRADRALRQTYEVLNPPVQPLQEELLEATRAITAADEACTRAVKKTSQALVRLHESAAAYIRQHDRAHLRPTSDYAAAKRIIEMIDQGI